MTRTVLFPGLGLEFHLDRVAFQLFQSRREEGKDDV